LPKTEGEAAAELSQSTIRLHKTANWCEIDADCWAMREGMCGQNPTIATNKQAIERPRDRVPR
jgi:hypothetical protein